MALVTFKNGLSRDAYLHMRIGQVGVPPEDRGTSNTVVKVGDSADINVGSDGDVWYCFGNQNVNNTHDPPLCKADGGDKVTLKSSQPCYVDN